MPNPWAAARVKSMAVAYFLQETLEDLWLLPVKNKNVFVGWESCSLPSSLLNACLWLSLDIPIKDRSLVVVGTIHKERVIEPSQSV